jgi:3-oxoacyl-[acyl-carrier protein] reductase
MSPLETDPFRLDGRVAVVTGGGGWLGGPICKALARAGAAVAVVGRTLETVEGVRDEVVGAGGTAIAVTCDVSKKADADAMAAGVVSHLGGIDVLVNNAAIVPVRPWTEIPEDEWDAVLATNLKGCFLCSRACFSSMRERGAGRIINLTSTTFSFSFPNATVLAYVTTKGGVVGFTRQLAREVGRSNVTVNALAPGAFESFQADAQYNEWVLDRQSLKRRGVGEDVGNAVVFLASDAASFITGQTLVVDGGMATP